MKIRNSSQMMQRGKFSLVIRRNSNNERGEKLEEIS